MRGREGQLDASSAPELTQERCSMVMKRGGDRARPPDVNLTLSFTGHDSALGPSHPASPCLSGLIRKTSEGCGGHK